MKTAFKILDVNGDGRISLEDFNDLFCSYGGMRLNTELWDMLLREADMNHDGAVSEGEFTEAMCNIIRKSLKIRRTTHHRNTLSQANSRPQSSANWLQKSVIFNH